MNRVMLMGNVGKDPEVRSTQSGKKVASFSIATSESWKDKSTGERKERTEWHNIVVWGDGLVGVVERFVKKGSRLFVEGQIKTRSWEKDGVTRYSTEVVLDGIGSMLRLLDKPEKGDASEGGFDRPASKPTASKAPPVDDMDDDIPF